MNAITPGFTAQMIDQIRTKVGGTSGEVLDLSSLLSALWRRKFSLISAALLGIILGALWLAHVAVPQYRATATLVMEPQLDQIVDISGVVPGLTADNTAVNTEVEVLRSRALMGDVARAMALMRDPEFNPALRPPGLLETLWTQGESWTRTQLGLPPATPDPLMSRRGQMTATIDTLRERVLVRNIPDSLVFEVVTESPDAEKAARISNALSARYIERQIETKFAATEQATGWLSVRVAELKGELEKAETQAKGFAAQMELINPETLEALAAQLKEVRERILARESAASRGGAASTRAKSQLAGLRQLEVELSSKITRQSQDLVTLEQLQREAEADRLIYEYFLSRLKETSVQQGIQQADSSILSPAEVPEVQATPRPVLVLLMSAALGFALMAVKILKFEAGRSSFRTPEELEERTGYTVMGQIPRIPSRRRKGVLNYVVEKPTSAAVEAIRNLRTSVFMAGNKPPKVIMLTSSVPGEGKTTQALALAQNMSGLGKKVLVIEGDIRRRMFRKYFNIEDGGGMLAVTEGELTVRKAVWHNETLGVDILAGDKTRMNAADLFSSGAFAKLMREARKAYDVVIVDTPPVLIVPDARVIAKYADAILYTVHWDKTMERQVLQGLRSFETVGLKVSGLVLSKVDGRGLKRYGYGDSYDAKGYYHN